jgi:hypothetical protein
MGGEKTYDLHDCELLVFTDWSEEVSYFERITITDLDEARAFLADEIAIDAGDLDPQPIHMRWATPESGEVWTTPEGDECDGGWSECEADHPDAVPFWKEAP